MTQAAINHYGSEYGSWYVTDDADRMLACDEENIIYGGLEDVYAELLKRHPCDIPGLTHVVIAPNNGQFGQIGVHKHPVYDGNDLDEVKRLAKEHPEITINCTDGNKLHGAPSDWRPKSITDELRDEGYSITSEGIKYEPIRAAQQLEHYKPTQKWDNDGSYPEQPITRDDVRGLADALHKALPWFAECETHGPSTTECLSAVSRGISIANCVYNKGAYRKLEAFQRFRKKWERNLKKNQKKYKAFGTFVAWMDEECTKRRVRKTYTELRVTKRIDVETFGLEHAERAVAKANFTALPVTRMADAISTIHHDCHVDPTNVIDGEEDIEQIAEFDNFTINLYKNSQITVNIDDTEHVLYRTNARQAYSDIIKIMEAKEKEAAE